MQVLGYLMLFGGWGALTYDVLIHARRRTLYAGALVLGLFLLLTVAPIVVPD